jgi:hypothetical protein
MAYYWTCPECGSNNDPGEACDCQTEKKGAAPLARKQPQAQRPTSIITAKNRIVKEECSCRTA